MTRREQIKEAAYNWAFQTDDDSKINDRTECEYGFKKGAEWADSNPTVNAGLFINKKEYNKLEQQFAIAEEALKKLNGNVPIKFSPSYAKEALIKIMELKK